MGSVSYPLLGKILKEIFFITVKQYFGEEFYAPSTTSDFTEVKRTTLTYPSSKSGTHWLPGASTSTPSCSHSHTGLTPTNFDGIYTMQAKCEQSLTLYTQKTTGISYLRVEHGAKRFERRGPRWNTRSNQNYSSHSWALYNLLSCLGHRVLWMCQFRAAGPAQTAPWLNGITFLFFPPFLLSFFLLIAVNLGSCSHRFAKRGRRLLRSSKPPSDGKQNSSPLCSRKSLAYSS